VTVGGAAPGDPPAPRLYHFSDDPAIAAFEPRPVRVPAARPPGMEWLNGALVWAIAEAYAQLYLFPRECPRIVLWRTPATTPADRARWLDGVPDGGSVADIERAWLDAFETAEIYRYELPAATFVDLGDAGMWVSRVAVTPIERSVVRDLAAALTRCRTTLRVVESLLPLKDVWQSSVHASGIRLRNARGWA
jgi:hypothetical protein